MWPWGHAAIGYLGYTLFLMLSKRRFPTRGEALAVLIGTQGPDLIDKPLAWTFEVLPTGRSLGHSLLTAALLCWIATLLLHRFGLLEFSAPFCFGYFVGILTDVPPSIFRGDFSEATFLLWPVLPAPTVDMEPSFTAHLQAFELTPSILGQTVLFVFATLLMVFRSHHPGSVETR